MVNWFSTKVSKQKDHLFNKWLSSYAKQQILFHIWYNTQTLFLNGSKYVKVKIIKLLEENIRENPCQISSVLMHGSVSGLYSAPLVYFSPAPVSQYLLAVVFKSWYLIKQVFPLLFLNTHLFFPFAFPYKFYNYAINFHEPVEILLALH